MEDESDQEQENDEAEKINNPINKEYKKKKKAKLQQLSTSKQERIEDHKRYLQFLKQELKEMLDKKVNLKEIKEHINIILSEIGDKSRAQELSQVNVESHEIRFQNQQPICELKLKREIKGLKFAKDCDRITKLKPVDYEDIIESQNQIQIEEEQKDFQEYQTYHYSPQFRYEQKPSPLQTDLIQVSLDVTRSQTPNKRRLYRTNPRFESDFTINRFKKKSSNKNTKQQKYQKQTQPIMMKKDPLNDNFPYLHKYKPELLKTILEARINLEQLI
ncbi:unnamed protein product [Paramecium sonneborni]|uniref:Uncharacterized protein n=1 Tax=Paramecium sonneborni TaxID=65129 RepID=A0A8S1NAB9_9CILI|nr:unnamed protein product [Paramecium sonneborni]